MKRIIPLIIIGILAIGMIVYAVYNDNQLQANSFVFIGTYTVPIKEAVAMQKEKPESYFGEPITINNITDDNMASVTFNFSHDMDTFHGIKGESAKPNVTDSYKSAMPWLAVVCIVLSALPLLEVDKKEKS